MAIKIMNAGVEMSHHVERFFAAVSALVEHGPIKQRLIKAYEEHLEALAEDDLHLEVQQSFARLRSMMHGVVPANGEGPICATVRKMSKLEADQCARLIVEMYGEVIRHTGDMQSPLPLTLKDRLAVPPFLVKTG